MNKKGLTNAIANKTGLSKTESMNVLNAVMAVSYTHLTLPTIA